MTLNRPNAGNAIDIPLARALMEAAIICDDDASIRCVVLGGAGRLFCAGGDITGFADNAERPGPHLKEITGYLHVAMSRLARMAKPLVTVINGPAAGAGLSLAILGDIALAAKSAHFTLAYPAIGLSPDGGATWMLPRLVGLRRAQEMALLNKRIGAEEAAAIGLITRTVEDAGLSNEAEAVVAQLAVSATAALGRARRLLLESFSATFETQMEFESRAIAESANAPDGREGVAAFIGKRKPEFKGH